MARTSKQLLWVDNDGKDRFAFERLLLENRGWVIHWSLDIRSAAKLLAKQAFDAIVLDQALSFNELPAPKKEPETVWGGCILLRWLRGMDLPSQLGEVANYGILKGIEPLPSNSAREVLFVSGFHNEEVETAIRETSEIDRYIEISPKPVEKQVLLRYTGRVGGG